MKYAIPHHFEKKNHPFIQSNDFCHPKSKNALILAKKIFLKEFACIKSRKKPSL